MAQMFAKIYSRLVKALELTYFEIAELQPQVQRAAQLLIALNHQEPIAWQEIAPRKVNMAISEYTQPKLP